MSGVILTSGRFWRTLVAMKCLAKHGIKVACGESKDTEPFAPAAFCSRYCRQHFYYPPFQTEPEKFVNAICDFANKHKEFDVLMPVNLETYVIAKYIDHIKSRSPHLKIPLHSYEYLVLANDKLKISQLAAKINIPIPQTFYPGSSEEVKTIAEHISYPAVIKIRTGAGGDGMTYVNSSDKMETIFDETVKNFSLDSNNLPMIQEYIPGTDYVAAALFNHGQLKAKVAFKSLRNIPPSGGLSVLRMGVSHEQMLNYLVSLANEMCWHGVITADFRVDERDNTPKLLEVNPRFWYSLYQAIASGVEFPYLLYKIAVDNDVHSVENYTMGIKTGFIWSETLSILAQLREPGNKVKALKKFWEFKTTKFEDACFSDPLPILAMALNVAIKFMRR